MEPTAHTNRCSHPHTDCITGFCPCAPRTDTQIAQATAEQQAWYNDIIAAEDTRKAAKRARAKSRRLRKAQQTPQGLLDQLETQTPVPTEPITVRYASSDRFTKTRKFATLAAAQRFAQRWIGETPELGQTYAISGDGIGKITASIPVAQLFPKA